jgi:ADP-ribose pyrophosphatase
VKVVRGLPESGVVVSFPLATLQASFSTNLEVWELRIGISARELDTAFAWISKEGTKYRETIEDLFTRLKNGEIPLGDVQRGEREIVGIVALFFDKWWKIPVFLVRSPVATDAGIRVKEHTYFTFGIPSGKKPEAAQILATTTDGGVVVVEQYRDPERAWTVELPGGLIDADEGVGDAAVREAIEEAKIKLTPKSEVKILPPYRPNVGCSAEFVGLVRVTHVEVLPQSEAERKVCRRIVLSQEEFFKAVVAGQIHDGHSLAAICFSIIDKNLKGVEF